MRDAYEDGAPGDGTRKIEALGNTKTDRGPWAATRVIAPQTQATLVADVFRELLDGMAKVEPSAAAAALYVAAQQSAWDRQSLVNLAALALTCAQLSEIS